MGSSTDNDSSVSPESIAASSKIIAPHGGVLINRQLFGSARAEARAKAKGLLQVPISPVNALDVELIATGAYSPLTGFIGQADYESVLKDMRLADGTIWPIPITLSTLDDNLAHSIKIGQEIALRLNDKIIGIMCVSEKFRYDKEREAKEVYGTTEVRRHPGVLRLCAYQGSIALAGDIQLIERPPLPATVNLRKDPIETRTHFEEQGWQTVTGFQTRNPVHRIHEYIQKLALQVTDGLFIQPLVGTTRREEIPIALRIRSYQVAIEHYYPKERVFLSVFPAAMCFAGPREAVFHALCRKNYGCTHFIVGRDHAGVGGYYKPEEAAKIFKSFSKEEIDINILTFDPYLCTKCCELATSKVCPHKEEAAIDISGTEIRQLLNRGEMPPPEFMRPEVSECLIDGLSACEIGSK